MAKVFEAHIKVDVSLDAMQGGPITYTDRFALPLGDEYDHGEVLAAFIHHIGKFQRDIKSLPAAVREANRVMGSMDPGTL